MRHSESRKRNQEIVTARDKGESLRALSERFRLSRWWVSEICRNRDEHTRPSARQPGSGGSALRAVQIVGDLLARLGNQTQIAMRNNVSRQYVSLIATEMKKRGLLGAQMEGPVKTIAREKA